MLTDDEARTLLHRAADTIEVGPAEPLPTEQPTRRWPVVIGAAAATIVVVAGVLAIGLTRDDDSNPSPAPKPPATDPVETPYPLADDQIPSVLGYHLDEATELLEDKGLMVVEHPEPTACQPPDMVFGTLPSVGAKLRPGDVIKVFVTAPKPTNDCRSGAPWQTIWELIRFARGLDGPPAMARELFLNVRGERPVSITRKEAADPDAWTLCENGECHSALAAIEQLATQSWGPDGRPYVAADLHGCGSGIQLGGWSYEVYVTAPGEDAFHPRCPKPSVWVSKAAMGAGLLDGVGIEP